MANKEIKVGDVGTINGVEVRCLAEPKNGICGRETCAFWGNNCQDGMMCTRDEREDGRDVFYSLV